MIKYINKNNVTCFNIICIIIIIFLIYLLINNKNPNPNLNPNPNHKKENFKSIEDTIKEAQEIMRKSQQPTIPPPPPEVRVFGPGGVTTAVDNKPCSTTDDVLGFCKDYENCCSGSSSTNCICINPIVTECKKEYDACMSDTSKPVAELRAACGDKNNTCCSKYTNNIDRSLFNEPVAGTQMDNVLCNIGNIKNVDQKCLELCQTNPNCAAYSLTDISCKLHNKATFKPPPSIDKNSLKNTRINFISKK